MAGPPSAKTYVKILREIIIKTSKSHSIKYNSFFPSINKLYYLNMKVSMLYNTFLVGYLSCQKIDVFTTVETIHVISTQGQTEPPTTRTVSSSVITSQFFLSSAEPRHSSFPDHPSVEPRDSRYPDQSFDESRHPNFPDQSSDEWRGSRFPDESSDESRGARFPDQSSVVSRSEIFEISRPQWQ